ncbi:MAG TPA: hypothetical protein VIG76_11005 [Amnibacterium sp.]|jgi:hypothetical protein|uniref:hypothetical protein n=1 Tax=Amnibacterium sp. TaxID=1872496 RepID=UPI002F93BE6E
MSDVARPIARSRAVPERFAWSLVVLLVGASLYGLVAVITLVVQVIQLIEWAQPGARIPFTEATSYVLPTNGMRNDYGGAPFVRDGTPVTATQVSTTLDAVPAAERILLGLTPVLWTITALIVTALLAIAISRLLGGAGFGTGTSRPVILAAAALAIGSSVAQILQGVVALGMSGFTWAAPHSASSNLFRTDGFTFEFTPLFAAAGLVAIALVLRRGLALQQDVDGLV